jgi:hypothetical protein
MTLKSKIINTREDLDAIKGTPEHTEFMESLRGSMTRKQDVQVYPDNYNDPDYDGDEIPPVWEDVEDLSTIERFGFTKADFQ